MAINKENTSTKARPSTITILKDIHQQIGHQGMSVLKAIAKQLGIKNVEGMGNCSICLEAKATRAPIGKKADPQYRNAKPGESLHSDMVIDPGIWDPINGKKVTVRTRKGHRYLLVITDERSHVVWVYLLKYKDEAAEIIKQLILFLRHQTGVPCKMFNSDGAGEYVNKDLEEFFNENQIIFKTSPAHTPERNGIAERMNRTLFEMVRCMLLQAQCDPSFWGEAVVWAAHVYNVTPHPICGDKSPFEILFKYKYDLDKLGVWGCDAFVQYTPPKQTKLGARAWKGIFLGFDRTTSSYRIMRTQDKRVLATPNVKFMQDSFTLIRAINGRAVDATPVSMGVSVSGNIAQTTSVNNDANKQSRLVESRVVTVAQRIEPYVASEPVESPLIQEEPVEAELADESARNGREPVNLNISYPAESPLIQAEPEELEQLNESSGTEEQNELNADVSPIAVEPASEPEFEEPGTGLDLIQEGEPEADISMRESAATQTTNNIILRTRSGRVVKSNRSILDNPDAYDPKMLDRALNERLALFTLHEEEPHTLTIPLYPREFLCAVTVFAKGTQLMEPTKYREAIQSPQAVEWDNAMKKEVNSLKDRMVFMLIPRSTATRDGKKILKGGWVYKIKLDENNEVSKYKARFVAKGYLQEYGRDFFDTHSPVARMKSIRLLLSIAAALNLEIHQIDFETAFLNAPVEEDIYMEQPDGFNQDPSMVWKLNKSLYGLKQASRNWNIEIHKYLISIGYQQLKSDPCIYFKRSRSGRLILLALYVDDTIIVAHKDDLNEWYEDKKEISKRYPIQDLGECKWILNMKVTRDRSPRVITLSQEAYIERLVKEYDMTQCRYTNTPAENSDLSGETLDKTEVEPLDEAGHERYRSLVGALMYIANITRLDVAFRVGQLARFVSQPCKHHLKAAMRVLRYLRHNSNYVATFGANPNDKSPLIEAYSDADWAGCRESRRSTTGGIIRFNGDVISWISKRQRTVALSTAEAEYIALTETAKEIRWLQQWIQEMFKSNIKGIVRFKDRQAIVNVTGVIKCDNRAAILLGKADGIHERTKHFDLKLHFIREQVTSGNIVLEWVESAQQHADILTKVLPTTTYLRLRDQVMSQQISE